MRAQYKSKFEKKIELSDFQKVLENIKKKTKEKAIKEIDSLLKNADEKEKLKLIELKTNLEAQ